jgi:hypothetical protein
MKKIFLCILTMMYMMVSSGFAMEIHYCMGKKAGVGLYGTANDKCGRCGMKANTTGCCHDEHHFYKLSDSHKNVFNNISFAGTEKAVIHEYLVIDWDLPSDAALRVVNNHSPPDDTGPSACVLNCVFRL